MARRRRTGKQAPEQTEEMLQQLRRDDEQRARQLLEDAVERGKDLRNSAERLRRLPRWRRFKRASLHDDIRYGSLSYFLALQLWWHHQQFGPVGPRPPDWMADDVAELRKIMAQQDHERAAQQARQRSLLQHQKQLREQDRVGPAERDFLEYAKRYIYER